MADDKVQKQSPDATAAAAGPAAEAAAADARWRVEQAEEALAANCG
eukprot:gene15558-8367_t